MKKYPNVRLEPIRLRNNKEPLSLEFQQGMLLQMIEFKKKEIAHLKKEENDKIMRINSKFLGQCIKPYEEETRFSKPNMQIQILKHKEMVKQQNRSRNQEDSNDEQGSISFVKTQSVSEYKNRYMKYINPYLKMPKKTYISSIVQNEYKPILIPMSYRKNKVIEGIEEEKYTDGNTLDKRTSFHTNSNVNSNNINAIPELSRKPSIKKVFNQKNKEKDIDKDKDKDKDKEKNKDKVKEKNNEKDKDKSNKTSQVSETHVSLTRKDNKIKVQMIKIIKLDKKAKVLLAKRDLPLPTYNSYSQLRTNHNYIRNPLTSASNPMQQSQSIVGSNSPSKSLAIQQIFYYTINKSYRIQFGDYFSHRTNWAMVNKQAKQINFQWKYFCKNVDFRKCIYDPNQPLKKQMMVNLFDNNNEIGNKKNLFLNLIRYCNKININVFEIIPFTIILSNGKSFDQTMEALEEMMTFINAYSTSSLSSSDEKGLFLNKLYKDHFPNDNLVSNDDKTLMYIANPFLSMKNYWILKPVDLFKGMGIQLSNNIAEMKKLSKKILIGVDTSIKKETLLLSSSSAVNNAVSNSINSITPIPIEQSLIKEDELNTKKQKNISHIYCSSQILIQKYLDNPLLYNKRKFDIRCYVLVDHNFNVYYCREGHLKGCSIEYDIETKSPFAHITNHSFQKHSENFQKYEYGNEMSYQNFKDFLTAENISLTLFDAMISKMKYAIEISMNAVGSKLNKKEKMLSFEIFGYDFIIDNHFTPWILEINNNPGLGISSPVIEKLVPRMLDDAFRLTIDTYFETKYDLAVIDQNTQLYKSKFCLDGYSDNENIFEFLCNIDKLP